jgi:general secretion pathway protein G
LVELLVTILIVGLLASIAIPNLLTAHRRSRYSRTASDTRTLVTQALLFGHDHGVYPTTVAAIRNGGYTNIPDTDPWSMPWQLSATLMAGDRPGPRDDVYIFSRGARAVGVYPVPFAVNTGEGGSVGYSSIYGSWSGL